MIATGGFRTVRLWAKSSIQKDSNSIVPSAVELVATGADQSQIAWVNAIGDIEIWQVADKRKLHSLRGHEDQMTSLSWSPASDRLCSCDLSGSIRLWQPSTGRQLVAIDAGASITKVNVSADGSTIAAVTTDRKVLVWKVTANPDPNLPLVTTAQAWQTIQPIGDANDIVMLDKPQPSLAIATESTGVLILSASDGKQIRKIDHGSPVTAVIANHDRSQLITGGRDGKIRTWQSDNGQALATFQGDSEFQIQLNVAQRDVDRQKSSVARLDKQTEELQKALAKEDEAVKKRVEERDKAKTKITEEQKKLSDAQNRVNATTTSIAQTKTTQQTADGKAAALIKTIAAKETEKKTAASAVALAKQARDKIAAMLAEEEKKYNTAVAKVNIVDSELAKAKQDLAAAQKSAQDSKAKLDSLNKQLEGEKKAVETATTNKQNADQNLMKREQALAAANHAQKRAAQAVPAHKSVVEQEKRRQALLETKFADLQKSATGPDTVITDLSVSPDGKRIASRHINGSVRTFSTESGLPFAAFDCAADSQGKVHFMGNRSLCTLGDKQSETFSLETNWRLVRTIGSPSDSPISDRVTAMDFRRDGKTLVVGSGPPSRFGDVKVLSVADGQVVRDFGEVHSDTVLGLKFSPNGRTIASSSADKTIRLLDVATGKVVRSLEGHTHHVLSVAWQDDGQTVASASADQNIKVWNIETGGQRRTIGGFGKEITAISFVQQSSQVVSACADGQVRLHETSNGKAVRTFNASGDFLFAVAITDDGKRLVAGGQNGLLRVWQVSDAKQLHEIK